MKERFNEATCGRVSDISPCRPAYGSGGNAAATVDSEGRPSDWMAYQLKWPEAAADKRGAISRRRHRDLFATRPLMSMRRQMAVATAQNRGMTMSSSRLEAEPKVAAAPGGCDAEPAPMPALAAAACANEAGSGVHTSSSLHDSCH